LQKEHLDISSASNEPIDAMKVASGKCIRVAEPSEIIVSIPSPLHLIQISDASSEASDLESVDLYVELLVP
jgi:hypothetical protein